MQWQGLLKREMTRKEFLVLAGFAILVLLRIEPILRAFGKSANPLTKSQTTEPGYGGTKGTRL